MKTSIKAAGTALTSDLEGYINAKVKAFERFVPDGEEALCEVELKREGGVGQSGDIYYAEANLTIGGALYRATSNQSTFQAAIDVVKDEMLNELRKRKGKRMHIVRESGAKMKNWLRGFTG